MGKTCHQFGGPWDDTRSLGFREDCLACGAPLHCCKNCRFYAPASYEWCGEPQARDEKPRDPEEANRCDYFLFGESGEREAAAERERKARDELAKLFGAGSPEDGDSTE